FAQNLVPNHSFEEYSNCPSYPGDMFAIGWQSIYTADYYNSCDDSLCYVSVPHNIIGYQHAVTGNAYSGLFTRATSNTFSNYREFISCQLNNPLTIGEKYYVSFMASLADKSNCATNNLGALFSTVPINFNSYPIPLTNHANIYSYSIIIDSANWVKISGSFIADSAYSYMYITNFYDNFHTDSILFDTTIIISPLIYFVDTICWAYYYIDDVCVSEDSLDCPLLTKISLKSNSTIFNIFPNPAYDKIEIELNINDKYSFALYNNIGKIVLSSENISGNTQIDINELPTAIYILQIKFQDIIFINKIFNLK
ncbi:MAG: T9SS type A sorting domain-containing protein, partial [Bacteroidia bacterium]|nr:T9SS type A sorting domain-containing protein [Bacteroidia bacterium]